MECLIKRLERETKAIRTDNQRLKSKARELQEQIDNVDD